MMANTLVLGARQPNRVASPGPEFARVSQGPGPLNATRRSSRVLQAHKRTFEMVPYGQSYNGHAKSICADGLVKNATLQLTHWSGNDTPAEYYEDLSTEIALKFAATPEARAEWADAVVLNNHFDTDGVMSCWALLNPEAAAERSELMIQAAQVGDFGEWPGSYDGILLDAALCKIRKQAADDPEAYRTAFAQMPELLDNLADRNDLWGDCRAELEAAELAIASGNISFETLCASAADGKHVAVAVIHHRNGAAEIPEPLISRQYPWSTNLQTVRYLLAFDEGFGHGFRYKYIPPGHAWVATITRPRIPALDGKEVAARLGSLWIELGGLVGGVGTTGSVHATPEEMLRAIIDVDLGLTASCGDDREQQGELSKL